jgi:SOS-response transcriptional repressor LexA
MLRKLTARQTEWLQCFQRLLVEKRRPPTCREWSAAMGCGVHGIGQNGHPAEVLERKGYIERDSAKARGRRLKVFVLGPSEESGLQGGTGTE